MAEEREVRNWSEFNPATFENDGKIVQASVNRGGAHNGAGPAGDNFPSQWFYLVDGKPEDGPPVPSDFVGCTLKDAEQTYRDWRAANPSEA